MVNGYKDIENRVVGTYTKIEDKFVDQYLTHEGESVEDAKKRIAREQAAADERHKAEAEAVLPGRRCEPKQRYNFYRNRFFKDTKKAASLILTAFFCALTDACRHIMQ